MIPIKRKERGNMELDMTKGSPAKLIARFIIPIIIGNIFSLGSHIQIARPVKPVCSPQAVMNLFVVHVQVQDEILAINRFVFYIKTKHHKEL